MPKLIPCLRLLNATDFTSGADIARQLDISRASVSTTLAHAETFGIAIERRHGLGYRLQQTISWLDETLIRSTLSPQSPFQLEISDHIESTNRALLANPRHGRVLVAEWQSGGRGRMGRKWQGQLGGSLLFSLAWTFTTGPAQLAGLPLAVGVALARAIRAAGVAGIGLKWPNDLLLPDGKAGGILIEMQGDALGPAQMVIGIGLNLRLPSAASALDQPVAALADAGLCCERNALLGQILNELEHTLSAFAVHGFAAVRAEWEHYHAWQQQAASVLMPDGQRVQGILEGVADDGALRVRVDDAIHLIHSGDVSVRRSAA